VPETEPLIPQDLEAERALLGSILIDNAALVTAVSLLSKDDFYVESHRLLFTAMVELSDQSSAIDLVTLSSHLRDQGLLERTGGAAYVASLTDGVPFGAGEHFAEYCRIIRGKSDLRRLLNMCRNGQAMAMDGRTALEVVE
jgi:replicative DNA helicase